MGIIGNIFGQAGQVGSAVAEVAEVFVPNATRRMELPFEARSAALGQLGAEFSLQPLGRFDRLVSALNRLPRPALALGTLGLFVFAMVDPVAFAHRMTGLSAIPEPLWWLLGAVVSFYFGARELHHFRLGRPTVLPVAVDETIAETGRDGNAALDEWRKG